MLTLLVSVVLYLIQETAASCGCSICSPCSVLVPCPPQIICPPQICPPPIPCPLIIPEPCEVCVVRHSIYQFLSKFGISFLLKFSTYFVIRKNTKIRLSVYFLIIAIKVSSSFYINNSGKVISLCINNDLLICFNINS